MNFSAWAIKKPIPSLLLFGLATLAGLVGFRKLPIQHFPDLDYPIVIVTAALPGGTPSTLETEITRRIEDSVATVGAVKHISSTVSDGASVTSITFNLEKDLQEAVSDVHNAVDRIRNQLPAEMQEPVISRVNTSGDAILTYTAESSSLDESELSWFVDNEVSKSLLSVDGVGFISRIGGVNREMRVELDPTKLLALNVTAAEVSSQLRRVQQESPGGRANFGGLEQSVRTIGTVTDSRALAGMQIPLSDGRAIRLDAIATIHDVASERRQAALLNGKPTVVFQITRARGNSEVTVANLVRAKMEALGKSHPQVTFREVDETITPVLLRYESSMHSLYEGAILAVIVVWLFLRDWRATFVSAVALPLSVLPTFAVISLLGFQLNTITLLALTLIVGVLVDDAIVEIENVERHLGSGKPPREAALEAANEIGLAVIATSLTLVAVFLPTAFMGGLAGKVFTQFGWTASIAVLFSLLVARLLTPMMAASLMKARPSRVEKDGRLMLLYLRAVRGCLAHPIKTLMATGAFFLGSLGLLSTLSTGFLEAEDNNVTQVSLETPPGASIEETIEMAERARLIVAENTEVKNVLTTIGSAGASSGSSEVRKAKLLVTLSPAATRTRSQQAIEAALRRRLHEIPGVRFTVGVVANGGQVTVTLAGDNPATLYASAQRVMTEIRALPDMGPVSSSANLLRPEIVITPDNARAAALGVNTAAISQAVRVATASDYDQNLPRINLPNRQLYIRTQFPKANRDDLETIRSLRVPGRNGSVPLGNVAKISLEGGPAQIDRLDRHRNITITIDPENRPTGDVTKRIMALPALRELPADVQSSPSGDAEAVAELFSSFGLAMAAGVLCVYVVLVLLFHDFLQPVTILTALPLSMGGAFSALAIFGYSLSLSSMLGLIMLMGVVTKNSILIVEYAITSRDELGMTRMEAIVDACHKRARPVIMTTIAMIAGMLPMALQLGASTAFRVPMALSVIGGLVTSTALSLLVVPVVFEVVDDFKMKLQRLFRTQASAPIALIKPAAST